MKLMTKAILKRIPKINKGNGVAHVKFFTPDANFTWYATEFDGEDLFFGVVVGYEKELGYFSLYELESVRGGLGLKVERDRSFAKAQVYTTNPFNILV